MNTSVEKEAPWRSRGAWLCALALILCQFALMAWLHLGSRNSIGHASWLKTPPGSVFTVLLQGGLWMFLALVFSGTPSISAFVKRAGLGQGITFPGWCAAWLALGISLVDGYGASQGWTASSRRPHPVGYDSVGAGWWFFVLKSLVIVTLYEETVTRGFLYRAFRGSYGVLLSTILIVCFSSFFHLNSVSLSLFTFGCLAALWVLLCLIRERTASLWDCVFVHVIYNTAGIHLWWLAIAGMVLVMLYLVGCQPGWWGASVLQRVKPNAERVAPHEPRPSVAAGDAQIREGGGR